MFRSMSIITLRKIFVVARG